MTQNGQVKTHYAPILLACAWETLILEEKAPHLSHNQKCEFLGNGPVAGSPCLTRDAGSGVQTHLLGRRRSAWSLLAHLGFALKAKYCCQDLVQSAKSK